MFGGFCRAAVRVKKMHRAALQLSKTQLRFSWQEQITYNGQVIEAPHRSKILRKTLHVSPKGDCCVLDPKQHGYTMALLTLTVTSITTTINNNNNNNNS